MNSPTSRLQTFMNEEMAQDISSNPVFSSLAQELEHEREVQAMKHTFIYGIANTIAAQTTLPFILTIGQDADFKAIGLMVSAFSFDAVAGHATAFPIPNALGLTTWAGRGLSVQIVDQGASRDLTSGFIPFELISTPGYGINLQYPFPFRYLMKRNSTIKFDVRNRDVSATVGFPVHQFAIAFLGSKIYTA